MLENGIEPNGGPAASHAFSQDPAEETAMIARIAPASDPDKGRNAPRRSPAFTAAIVAIFASLDDAGICHVILHGHEDLPHQTGSDIDILVARDVSFQRLQQVLAASHARTGARLVRRTGGFITLSVVDAGPDESLVHLDFSHRLAIGRTEFMDATAILRNRVRNGAFWIPALGDDFSAYLSRVILKQRLDARSVRRLQHLMARSPETCIKALAGLKGLSPSARDLLATATASGIWDSVVPILPGLAAGLRTASRREHPLTTLALTLGDWRNRISRLLRPGGMSVVMLGPDGAGKSTVIRNLEQDRGLPFEFVEVLGFAPPIHRIVDKAPKKTDTPHALAPRSLPMSLVKAGYWLAHSLLGHVTDRQKKMANGLVLYDRHFMDILVDPVRYRYGGPRWVLRVIDRFTPVPDLIVLLDAPSEVLHARKPELEMAERHRQRQAYLDLVKTRRNAIIIDATMAPEDVLSAIHGHIVEWLAQKA